MRCSSCLKFYLFCTSIHSLQWPKPPWLLRWYRTGTTWIMTTFSLHGHLFPFIVDGFLFLHHCCNRFKGHVEINIHSVGNTTCILWAVRLCTTVGIKRIVVSTSFHLVHQQNHCRIQSLSPHWPKHGFSQFSVQFIESRFLNHGNILNTQEWCRPPHRLPCGFDGYRLPFLLPFWGRGSVLGSSRFTKIQFGIGLLQF